MRCHVNPYKQYVNGSSSFFAENTSLQQVLLPIMKSAVQDENQLTFITYSRWGIPLVIQLYKSNNMRIG